MDISHLYATRFDEQERQTKLKLWRVLCRRFFARYVRPTDAVLDLGAGYCEFINNIQCARRIAVDMNEDTAAAAAPGVQVIRASSTDLGAVASGSIDVVFVSNFFEHLPSKGDFLATLAEVKRVLVPGGRLLILQPNIRLIPGAYWDFVDHQLPLSDRTLVEALQMTGMRPVEVRARFLPYTTKGRTRAHPWLVRLYLRLRPAQWVFGKQAWVVAVRPAKEQAGDSSRQPAPA